MKSPNVPLTTPHYRAKRTCGPRSRSPCSPRLQRGLHRAHHRLIAAPPPPEPDHERVAENNARRRQLDVILLLHFTLFSTQRAMPLSTPPRAADHHLFHTMRGRSGALQTVLDELCNPRANLPAAAQTASPATGPRPPRYLRYPSHCAPHKNRVSHAQNCLPPRKPQAPPQARGHHAISDTLRTARLIKTASAAQNCLPPRKPQAPPQARHRPATGPPQAPPQARHSPATCPFICLGVLHVLPRSLVCTCKEDLSSCTSPAS